jgi:pimeloyl-ACP methyl ester carboxylesterase
VCGATAALAGGERAIADLDTVFEHMDTRADVGQKQVLVGGVSRGGALSVAYAGRSPQRVNGVVNFVGRWMGEKCAEVAAINPPPFSQGAGFRDRRCGCMAIGIRTTRLSTVARILRRLKLLVAPVRSTKLACRARSFGRPATIKAKAVTSRLMAAPLPAKAYGPVCRSTSRGFVEALTASTPPPVFRIHCLTDAGSYRPESPQDLGFGRRVTE